MARLAGHQNPYLTPPHIIVLLYVDEINFHRDLIIMVENHCAKKSYNLNTHNKYLFGLLNSSGEVPSLVLTQKVNT